jgi:hypothetical protein
MLGREVSSLSILIPIKFPTIEKGVKFIRIS